MTEMTPREIADAIKSGLSVERCRHCGKNTLYSPKAKPPETCGRMECLQKVGDELGKR